MNVGNYWKKWAFSLSFCFLSGVCYGYGAWTPAAKIKHIRIDNDNDALIVLEDMTVNPGNCTVIDSYRLSADNEAFKKIYLQILASYLAQHEIRLKLDVNSCEDKGPKIVDVELPDRFSIKGV